MRTIKIYIWTLVLLITAFSSCNESDEKYSVAKGAYELEGEWLMSLYNGDELRQEVYHFSSNGNYTWNYITTSYNKDDFNKSESYGVFSFDGTTIRLGEDKNGGYKLVAAQTINMPNPNSLTISSTTDLSNTTYHRIVGDINMQVGESTHIPTTGNSYSSTTEVIASIDENGYITAKKFGTAYIFVNISNNEDIVYRINVYEKNCETLEFTNETLLDKQDIIRIFGNNYVEDKQENAIAYLMGNSAFRSVTFWFDHRDKIDEIDVYYWPEYDLKRILKSFNDKYEYMGCFGNFEIYKKNEDGKEICCYVDTIDNSISYQSEKTDLNYFDEFIYMKADSAYIELTQYNEASLLRQTSGEYYLSLNNNSKFKYLWIRYDIVTNNITQILLKGNSNLQTEELRTWLNKEYYLANIDGHDKYVYRKDWWNAEPLVGITKRIFQDGNIGLLYETLNKY